MKYKKHIATGALAISLLVGGTPILAATPQDLGIKNIQYLHQKQNKNFKIHKEGRRNIVGTITMMNDTGFIMEIKNVKTNTISSVDVNTDTLTKYAMNGTIATYSDLRVGQKVIVAGKLDKATNIINAKRVRIVIN
ncbi:MAG: hypothetical protein WC609_02940 [Candidatus Paceibacterota bacterium]|jgi:hypothetical protein